MGHEARGEELKMRKNCLVWKNVKGRDQLVDLGVDGTILTWILKNSNRRVQTEFTRLRIGTGGEFF